MIYKTWFGKHIDLSKIISISDLQCSVYYPNNNQLLFNIFCQLLEKPIIYFENIKTKYEYMNNYYKKFIRCLDDNKEYFMPYDEWTYDCTIIKQGIEFQQKIDELVQVWKDFKEQEKQSKCCDLCINYHEKKNSL